MPTHDFFFLQDREQPEFSIVVPLSTPFPLSIGTTVKKHET